MYKPVQCNHCGWTVIPERFEGPSPKAICYKCPECDEMLVGDKLMKMWESITDEEYNRIFACSATRKGNMPNLVFVERDKNRKIVKYAVQYIEDGKWERWGLRNEHGEIKESWSTIFEWLRPLIGDNPAIEVYPRDKDFLDTAPTRWFWIIPGDLPKEFNLNE